MTALLKKRALAEYTQVLDPVPKPIKKLRLVKKQTQASASLYVGLLENSKTSNDALQLLFRISDSLQFKKEDLLGIIKKLAKHFRQQNESAVRVKILSLYANIGSLKNDVEGTIIDQIMKLIEKETSHKVVAQGLTTILELYNSMDISVASYESLQKNIYNLAKSFLKDTNHWVKQICFQIIGTINLEGTVPFIANYIHSQDARVRCAAMETLVKVQEKEVKTEQIPVSLYPDICQALNDDYEIVRAAALKIVCIIGITYSENLVKVNKLNEEIRLIDDTFSKVCHAVNDLSMNVRLQAMQLLGSMTKVSPTFLNQTLDKKLMSNMRKKKSLHERSNEMVTSGEWSSGKKWADDAPKELLHKDEVNVVSSGSCGAFVHGLEDEFMEVRTASVRALCNLALDHPDFALVSLDFLVDMFNDEIEAVRIEAIDSLTRMSRHIVLREHQLETILGALEDYSIDVREGLHRMLAACFLSTKSCLEMCVEHLLENLKKYPQDKQSTWQCVKEIGSKHSDLTLLLVPQLLAIHPFFDTPEPDVEDPHYITLLILVFNAAQHCPTMLQLFEEHTIKHYSYLRVTLPSLVPHLKLPGAAEFVEPEMSNAGAELLWRLVDSLSTGARVQSEVIQRSLPQLARLAEIDSQIAGPAEFITLFISCQVSLGKILNDKLWCCNAPNTVQGSAVKNNITQLLHLCLRLQYLFVGLEKIELAAVKQFQLKALALHLVYVVKATNLSALALCEHFLIKVERTQRYLLKNNVQPDEFCKGVFLAMSSLDDTKPGAVARCLLPLLDIANKIQPPKPNIGVRMCKAVLTGSSSSPDNPIKFTAGLVMATPIDAEITGLQDPTSLRIKIHYPDHQTHVCVPTNDHLRPTGGFGNYRLLTKALVSHGVWSEACYVEISLCIELSENEFAHRSQYSLDPYLELCKPLKLYVLPKPVKRGT
ncbi:integrator complex subunit 4 [Cimex lectularius]|uniref:Integrator complex subunit 4 n=1 Tax=Cimex lectularius TaxID=79782 RepID=A0A8I6RKI9_CIMLE|nr:integrator complex subunit 4 [Cimex lectularius]